MAVIRFDIDTVRPTDTGSALGQIWVEFSARSVPCVRWNDFIVFVLDWWRRGIEDIMNGAEAPTPFAFMDDPHEFHIVKSTEGYTFRCFFREEEYFSSMEGVAGLKDFVSSYLIAVRAIVERIEQAPNWREIYLGSAATLDDMKAAQPRLEAMSVEYLKSGS